MEVIEIVASPRELVLGRLESWPGNSVGSTRNGTSPRSTDCPLRARSPSTKTAHRRQASVEDTSPGCVGPRKSLYHARCQTRLANHLELLRSYYNFVRPHQALRFGKTTRTPAMQAGVAAQRLSFGTLFQSVDILRVPETDARPPTRRVGGEFLYWREISDLTI